MQEYMACMKAHRSESGKCRHLTRQYLECRMEKGLMEKDEMSNLGFRDGEVPDTAAATTSIPRNQASNDAQDSSRSTPTTRLV